MQPVNNTLIQYANDVIDYGIIGLLILLSIISLWIFIERMMFYKSLKLQDYTNKDQLELDLTNNISVVGAIASNAPYVGLLGTVLGIMLTFYTLGDLGAVDAKKIMTGLAMALKATAMGLLVAIPAIVFYTILNRKIEKLLTKYDILNEQ
ncbi:MAG: TonB-system energizer ExbB [Epsilonproteobacteria bacterium]|nr:TonB-system energizer ExbB [Campylobacterota bacterium]